MDVGRMTKERGGYISLLCTPAAVDTLFHANVLGAAADCTVSSVWDCYR